MVQEENEEFVNFSDEENVVTIPLDIFTPPTSQEKETLNSKVDNSILEENIEYENDIGGFVKDGLDYVQDFKVYNGSDKPKTDYQEYDRSVKTNLERHESNCADDHTSYVSSVHGLSVASVGSNGQAMYEKNAVSTDKSLQIDSKCSTGVDKHQERSKRTSVALLTNEDDVILRSECRTPSQFDFLYHLRKKSGHLHVKHTSDSETDSNGSSNDTIDVYENNSSNDTTNIKDQEKFTNSNFDETLPHKALSPSSIYRNESISDENDSISDSEDSFELESRESGASSIELELSTDMQDTTCLDTEDSNISNTIDECADTPDARGDTSSNQKPHTVCKDTISNKPSSNHSIGQTVPRYSNSKPKVDFISKRQSDASSKHSIHSHKIAWKSDTSSPCSNGPDCNDSKSQPKHKRIMHRPFRHTLLKRNRIKGRTSSMDKSGQTSEKQLQLERIYGRRTIPRKCFISTISQHKTHIYTNSQQTRPDVPVTSTEVHSKQSLVITRNSLTCTDIKLSNRKGTNNEINNVQLPRVQNDAIFTHDRNCLNSKKQPNFNINDLHTEIERINERIVSGRSKSNSKTSSQSLYGKNNTSLKIGNLKIKSALESQKDRSSLCNCKHGIVVPTADLNGSNKNRHEIDSVEQCNNSVNNISLQNDYLSKIETHSAPRTRCVVHDDNKCTINRSVFPLNILHENAPSRNYKIKPSAGRYHLDKQTSSNHKRDTRYQGSNFLLNGKINSNIYKKENSAPSFNVCKSINGRRPPIPCYNNQTNQDKRGKKIVKNGSYSSKAHIIYATPKRTKIQNHSNYKRIRGTIIMSDKVRQRNSSGLTDLARLQDIRRELLLAEPDNGDVQDVVYGGGMSRDRNSPAYTFNRDRDSHQLARTIVNEMLQNEGGKTSRQTSSDLKEKRFKTTDAHGRELLCCLLQVPSQTPGLSGLKFEIIDPLDVPRVTWNHELLISHVIKCKAADNIDLGEEEDFLVTIPVAHGHVQPWQEILVKWLDHREKWVETTGPVELVQMEHDKKEKELDYGVQLSLNALGCFAVLARPKTDSIALGSHSMTVTSSSEPSVKMRVPATAELEGGPKIATLQVVPLDRSKFAEFKTSRFRTQNIDITAASSLVIMNITGSTPETVSFVANCIQSTQTNGPPEPEKKPKPISTGSKTSRDVWRRTLPPTKDQRGPQKTENAKTPSKTTKKSNDKDTENKSKQDMHLVQIGDDSEVRLKLLTDTDRGEEKDIEHQTVRFSVYEKNSRCFAMKTKSGLQYDEIKKLTQTFTNFIVKHQVELRVGQHSKDVNSVHFSMDAYLPSSRGVNSKIQETLSNCNRLHTVIQIDEGDLVGIIFRGNIAVLNQRQKVYSFHAYHGITETFKIKVADPFSQRSLQNFHGELNIFILKGPRAAPVDKMEMPAHGSDWELRAECPLILPKNLKKTPVSINKAPISLRFQEPLTLDFINKICTDLVGDWELFARSLGLTHARLQSIKQQNRNVISERVLMDVIVCWMKQQPVSRDKVGPLLIALRKCSKWKLVAELSHRHQALTSDKTKSAKDKYLQRSMALVCKSKHVTCKWQQLYRHLIGGEIPEEEVHQAIIAIETKYDNDITRCYRALCRWKSETKKYPSVWSLVDALRFCNCAVAADSITVLSSKGPDGQTSNDRRL